jgi:hypothetical protein
MRINLLGWFDDAKPNCGDQAFKYVHNDFFSGHDLRFITPPRTCPTADLTILGGGAVAAPFYFNCLPPAGVMYGLGLDVAYLSEIDLLAKIPFKKLYVRNRSDLPEMHAKLPYPVEAIPDLAFWLKPQGKDILSRYKKKPSKKTLGVFVTDYVNPAIDRPYEQFGKRAQSFKTVLAKELVSVSDEYEVLLVPFSTGGFGDDRRINLDLAAYMAVTPTVVFDTLSPLEMIDLMTQIDHSLCMRFHSHIFSIIAATPFTSIDFTRKVKMLLQENGLEDTLGGWSENDDFRLKPLQEELGKGFDRQRLIDLAAANHLQLSELRQTIRQEWL